MSTMLGADSTHLVGSMNWEPVQKRLLGAELEDALQAVAELRENVEVLHGVEYPLMLSALLPALSSILTNRTKPSPDTTSIEHRLRHAVLEFMARFPQNDKLRPHAPHLVAVALDILQRDYEANALLSCRIIFDLFKVYRNLPQDHVQPFLDFVLQTLRNMPTAVIRNFSYTTLTATLPVSKPKSSAEPSDKDNESQQETPAKPAPEKVESGEISQASPEKETPDTADKEKKAEPSATPSTPSESSSSSPNRLALPSNSSFRVLTECPLILMLLFQFFPKFQKSNIPNLIAVMTEILGQRAPSFQSFPPSAKNDIHLKRIYYTRVRELIAAQTKTLSFLTYLLRGFSNELKPYGDRLASNVVALMSSCPKESVSTRKELLVATRHLLGSDFRNGFFRHIDVLLDEKVLMGSHHRYADNNLLRPLGYTTLSELVQHVRTKLNMTQVSRVVSIFSRVLHDSTVRVALGTQYSAVRTLLSLIDMVYHNKDPNVQLGRDILIRILSTLVDKLKSLVAVFPDIYSAELKREESRGSVWEKRPDPLAPTDTVRDVQSMVRAIIAGCKSLVYYAANYRNQRDKETAPRPQLGMNDEVMTAMLRLTNGEILIVQEYILSAIPAIKLLKEEGPSSYILPGDKTHAEHYRDALTYFAASFTGLDGFTLRRTLGRQLEFIIDTITRDPVAMVIPRHLLASNAGTSFEMCGIILNYLIERMDDLALPRSDGIVFLRPPGEEEDEETGSVQKRFDQKTSAPIASDEMFRARSSTLLQLFERILKSLSVYSENEPLIRRYLRRIVVECLRSSMENPDEWPDSYCMLLRYVFRSISAGKFEESYKELLPLIPTVLNGLYKTICASVELSVCHTAIELCLTIPARLSSLLPHMNLLLRVIVRALVSGVGDLVNLGLRTLEFWVDNLNPLFLYPEMSKQVEVFTSLMQALSRHLRPAPYPYGLLTLRLLGKLGGKNRQFLREPLRLPCSSLEGPDTVDFPFDWTSEKSDSTPSGESFRFRIRVPIARCTELLRDIATIPTPKLGKSDNIGDASVQRDVFLWKDSNSLWDCQLEKVDYDAYATDVMNETRGIHALACVRVIAAALAKLELEAPVSLTSDDPIHKTRLLDLKRSELESKVESALLGLLYGTMISSSTELSWSTLERIMPKLSPCWVASALSTFLAAPFASVTKSGMVIAERIVKGGEFYKDSKRDEFLQTVIPRLSDLASMGPWKGRLGPQQALLFVLENLGQEWRKQYEFRLVAAAFLSVKTTPRELSFACVESMRFFLRLCCLLYPDSAFVGSSDRFVTDPLLRYPLKRESSEQTDDKMGEMSDDVDAPCEDVVRLVLQELSSSQQSSRFAARIFLSKIMSESSAKGLVEKFDTTLRKLVFSRSLRILPLPQQVGAVEALIVIVNEFPGFLSIKDQHFLSFMSELLKMCSVSDGEMQDPNSLEAPNKNGYVRSADTPDGEGGYPTHCSSLFYRRDSVSTFSEKLLVVPHELPLGVQLRFSAIVLLHSAVVNDVDTFFDSESTTAVGNIRPHIVSLLFRSLASSPRSCVVAAYKALKDVLSLSMTPATEEGGKSQSRLPKELLQRCIRPVLLNLRDFTMLSVPLLRGLSRLLLLLNSWFNKTLGEKLLDHLQKWTDPGRIMALSWKPGQETVIAASAVGIFSLLPHASQFTELIVKTCIKLEAALPAFKNLEVSSPFRIPLARFLDKYPQEAAAFFFPRLRTPIYSDLFHDIVKLDQSKGLRAFLGNRSSSLMLLNRCFERPLAIMRAERGSSPGGGSLRHSLFVHGIGNASADQQQVADKIKPMDIESLELQYQGFRLISTLHEHDPDYLRNHNDIVRALRWLWRSKGRYLRLQHESLIPPRFHSESSMLAKFLMSYAEQFPNEDVGVLFELILVFLHTSTVDFSCVANFLSYMVCDVFDLSQKKKVLDRFFEMVGGDSNEETKVLTVQFIVFPLLNAELSRAASKANDDRQLVDKEFVKTFVETAVLKNGRPISCGDRLRVELLKLTDLLVAKASVFVEPFQKEIVKSIWSQTKVDDGICKSWAYVVACRLIATFDATPKLFMQVYSALLRSHHQEDKELVRTALDLLIPAMPSRLSKEEQTKAIEQLAQIMLEEASSTPQLAHLCQTVLRDGDLFFPCRESFISHLVSSVSRLALPPNSPFENRLLAIEIVALLMNWSEKHGMGHELLNDDSKFSLVNNLVRLKMLLTEAPDGRSIKFEHGQTSLETMIVKLLKMLLTDSTARIRSQPFEKVASRDKVRTIDSPALAASLDLFTIFVEGGIKDFFEENGHLVNTIVERSFELAAADLAVRSRLLRFTIVGGQTEILDNLIAVSVEKILLDCARGQKKLLESRLPEAGSRSPSRSSRDRQALDDASASMSFLVEILRALSELCSKRETFRLRLSFSLLSLGAVVGKHHVAEAAAKQRQGFSYPPRSATLGVSYTTPTVGILEAALQPESTEFAKLQLQRHRSGKDATPSSGVNDYIECLLLVLSTIERKDLPMSFTVERKLFVQLIGSLLDGSDSVHLLCLSARIIGKWLLPGSSSSPLTVKEKHSFLWRLSSFDWKLLPDDLSTQPLADLVACMIEQLPPAFGSGDGDDLVYGRSLVACLLNANIRQRKKIFDLYLKPAASDEESMPVTKKLTQFDVLWRLTHSDFEGIASRHWLVVFAEALLACVETTDPLLVSGLEVLVHSDAPICKSVFYTLFRACWRSCPADDDRAVISTAVETLLARPYHTQFLQGPRRTNETSTSSPVKDLLSVLPDLDPSPYIDPNLLVHLAEHHNSWHEAINHLESQYVALKCEPVGPAILSALRHCYKKLGETTIWMSLAVESCKFPSTEHAISLDVYGYLDEAIEAYNGMVSEVEAGTAQPEATDYEMDLWEERWVEIHREQCQLAVVTEFANSSTDYRLQLECSWKNREWAKLRALCTSTTLLSAVESGDALVKMSETLLAVAERKLSDVENLHAQTAQLCLYNWQLLPSLSSGSLSHAALLHFFHRLVEVRESGQIMVETASHSSGRTLPDLKNLLGAWRHRLPNDWEPMSNWDEIFAWRAQMFRTITSNFHWAGPGVLSTLHDAPWSSVRLAKTARKQGFREVSSLLLSQAEEREVNVADAYLKLREQILTYYNDSSELERHGGLNLVNTTNFDYFDVPQKSELFRLKATFLASLGGRSKANQAYCHALLILPENSRAWVSWGELCTSLGEATEEQIERTSSTGTESDKEAMALAIKKVPQYLTQAMGCFLEAIRIDANEWSRLYLPKCLWMLTKESTSAPVICPRFENRGLMLPAWVWLPWFPQLLTCLYRPEGRSIKRIFSGIVRAYPQAAYFNLRSFYLERRDVERALGSSSSNHMPSVAYAEDMMSLLRRSHPCLWSSLEAILEELIVKFRPSTEEEFLATIVALLERAESQIGSVAKSEEQNLSSSIQKTLSKIAFKYFRPSDSSQKDDERAKRTAEFKDLYRESFESDFHVTANDADDSGPSETLSLEEILSKIRDWKHKLQRQVLVMQPRIDLVKASQPLAVFGVGDAPELWPGSCDPRDASPLLTHPDYGYEGDGSGPVSSASSAKAARTAANGAAAAASALAAREGYGGEYGGGSSCIEIPGQYMPNSSCWADTRPSPELHIKMIRFDPSIEVVRRSDQLVRRIGILGSDGKHYYFLLQCALSYWTRTDERSSQIHFVLDKLLRRNTLSARAQLSVQPNCVIPIAQRLRLVQEQDSRTSLQEEYDSYCIRNDKDPEDAVSNYNEEVRKCLSELSSDLEGEEHEKALQAKRLEVYEKVKAGEADAQDILARQLYLALEGAESFFYFRRTFAQQWAIDCLLQYVFAVSERIPGRVVLIQNDGRVLSPNSRVSYSNQGYLESKAIPFRMTANILNVIGFPLLKGHFLPSMAKTAAAVTSSRDIVDPTLKLLLRDDLTSFYTKSIAKSDSKTQEMERQLMDRINKNAYLVLRHFGTCAPVVAGEKKKPLDHRLRELLEQAQDPNNLCLMQGSYQAWL